MIKCQDFILAFYPKKKYTKRMVQKKYKLCLGIDTASDLTSVALLDSEGHFATDQTDSPRGQGEILFRMIQNVFQKMGKTPKDLTHIAVTIGPGSFTGVRIGLSTARGLGLALNIPVLGVDNFCATAYGLKQKLTVVLDSKRDDYFAQDFDAKGHPINDQIIISSANLKKRHPLNIAGSGAEKLSTEISCTIIKNPNPLALNVAQIALKSPKDTTEPHPLYLRDADVTI